MIGSETSAGAPSATSFRASTRTPEAPIDRKASSTTVANWACPRQDPRDPVQRRRLVATEVDSMAVAEPTELVDGLLGVTVVGEDSRDQRRQLAGHCLKGRQHLRSEHWEVPGDLVTSCGEPGLLHGLGQSGEGLVSRLLEQPGVLSRAVSSGEGLGGDVGTVPARQPGPEARSVRFCLLSGDASLVVDGQSIIPGLLGIGQC